MNKKNTEIKEKEEYKKAQEIIREAFRSVDKAIEKEIKNKSRDKAYF